MKTDDAVLPDTVESLITRFRDLRLLRQAQHKVNRNSGRRTSLNHGVRKTILEKTEGRCHICGGLVSDGWQADHVLAFSGRGQHDAANLLPAHALCNNYRWDYLPEEFQWILKIGVWARTLMRKGDNSTLGRQMAMEFFKYEKRRIGRRATKRSSGIRCDPQTGDR